MEDVLKHPTRVLSKEQRSRFLEDRCSVVEGMVDGSRLGRLYVANRRDFLATTHGVVNCRRTGPADTSTHGLTSQRNAQ